MYVKLCSQVFYYFFVIRDVINLLEKITIDIIYNSVNVDVVA
jgi:hypothetical protein